MRKETEDMIARLLEDAEWCDANEWEIPIHFGDDYRMAADEIQRLSALSENGMGMPDPKNDITGDRADKYISLTDVIHDLEWLQSVGCHSITLCELQGRLEHVIPAVEANSVCTGTWEDGYCSVCGERCIGNQYEEWHSKFCPNCGAKMVLKEI